MDSQTRIMTFLSRPTSGKGLQSDTTLILPGLPRSLNRRTWDDSEALGLSECMANPNPNLSPKRSRRGSRAEPHPLKRDALCAFRILPSPESRRIS